MIANFRLAWATKQDFDSKANQPAIKWAQLLEVPRLPCGDFPPRMSRGGDGLSENFPF